MVALLVIIATILVSVVTVAFAISIFRPVKRDKQTSQQKESQNLPQNPDNSTENTLLVKEPGSKTPPTNVVDKDEQTELRDEAGNLVDSTGARIFSKEYYGFREEAQKYAERRSECYENSRKEFETGDKAKAKALSDEGKECGKKMEQAHKNAVEELLRTNRNDDEGKIDLHGMFVKEALEATEDFLQAMKKKDDLNQIEIVTGIGNHSKNNNAKIKPEIISLLNKNGLKFEAESHNDGAFIVYMKQDA